MGELKPCPNPWCWSTSAPVPICSHGWQVSCACGVQTFPADTADEAITAWNTRPRTEGRGEGEPVAWAYEYTNHLRGDRAPGGWLRAVAFEAPTRARVNAGFARNVRPLYASPIREPEISREALGEAIYLALYEHQGAVWAANESKGVWYDAADRLRAILNLAPVGGRGEEGSSQSQPGVNAVQSPAPSPRPRSSQSQRVSHGLHMKVVGGKLIYQRKSRIVE